MEHDIAIALIGVIATIAGTVLGWILNNLSSRGKLNIFVSSWKDSFKYINSSGEMVYCTKRDEVQSYSYEVSLDLYNSSGNVKIMRNIQIVFSDGNNDLKKEIPLDNATKRTSHMFSSYDKVGPINVPPKTVISLVLHDGTWNQNGELDFIWGTKRVYLTYMDEKNKICRKLMKDENYDNYFTTHKREELENG